MIEVGERLRATSPWSVYDHLRAELAEVFARLGAMVSERPPEHAVMLGTDFGAACLALSRDIARGAPTVPATEPPTAQLPVPHALRAFACGAVERDALLLALACELDVRAARLIALANEHAGRPRPTLGLAQGLSADWSVTLAGLIERPAFRDGLLELEGEGPLATRAVRVPAALLARFSGEENDTPPAVDMGLLERLVLLPETRDALARWATAARQARVARGSAPRPLFIIGTQGAGRSAAARAALSAAGIACVVARGLDAVELTAMRRDARWFDAGAVVELDDTTPLPSAFFHAFPAHQPVIVTLTAARLEQAAAGFASEPLMVELPELPASLRGQLWRALLPRGEVLEPAELQDLATRFHFGPGAVTRVIRRAVAAASLAPPGQRALDRKRLLAAGRAFGTSSLGPLVEPLPLPFTRDDLVVSSAVTDELQLAVAWVRQRANVLADAETAGRTVRGNGLAALFGGPPGTGKTMAAQVLAAELELDLLRVDLARVVSKWIGETEKNLAQVFDLARASGAALFFDEGDALFGKRSEVHDAQDRHANVEIAYLLQRLEQHDGVVIVATNRAQDVDPAFRRRFPVIVQFHVPGPEDRRLLWTRQLGVDESAGLPLAAIAANFELTGGEIKNAALAARFLAAAEGGKVTRSQLVRVIRRELQRAGRVADERAFEQL